MVRTRIAPAPTGPFHIGNARTALYNYLFAKHNGGKFVLRIEDTDVSRSEKKHELEIFASLRWLGIEPDEGPDQGGSYLPYRQSERTAGYSRELERLIASGQAYYCPHSDTDMAAEKQKQLESKQPPVHRCEWRERGVGEGQPSGGIIRFKTPADRTITFEDLIRGSISFESNLLGDFSMAKDLSTPLYNFAVVIDDQAMNISHVIRGEDHVSNTPKQILIQEALGLMRPAYAHLPLILGPDRAKLSGRHGATAIREFREAGYLPEALVNFMALLGWNPGDDRELLSMGELIREFDLARVQKSGAIFNIQKLNSLNGEYIRRKPAANLLDAARPFLPEAPDNFHLQVIAVEQPRLKKLSDLREAGFFYQQPEYDSSLLHWKDMTEQDVRESLIRTREVIEVASEFSQKHLETIFTAITKAGDKGRFLWPLRVALSGKKASPGPFEIMAILGKSETLKRIDLARRKISEDLAR
ncbi:MAG: glutamate--tRNA ligase [Patescibacteria group bacterium]